MIELNGSYKCRGGNSVRIYATDGEEPYVVHGALMDRNQWEAATWTKDGTYCLGTFGGTGDVSNNDLVPS